MVVSENIKGGVSVVVNVCYQFQDQKQNQLSSQDLCVSIAFAYSSTTRIQLTKLTLQTRNLVLHKYLLVDNHRLISSTSRVLTATGQQQTLTSYTIDIPRPIAEKYYR